MEYLIDEDILFRTINMRVYVKKKALNYHVISTPLKMEDGQFPYRRSDLKGQRDGRLR